ncbi:TMEM175 family protein [Enterococcus columbae]|uniref:Integral membrane protein n=1 Tax=Enterococcus columbae DSM 7374 = ATCC 51263 TaxID=1121865 RepID=S1P2Y5_9ENTE|nr:TMEM175 family protein [Enterococcus columbae]EOT43822.1 hypothetical protein OMW_00721 [Enterococcus columbae DSM 7374 = ATCC 51263]EOW87439.1 hypothetical protein I568_00483 [Enterococcus columbae DSM 7374 = ATCC 51263]OJG22373.1 hypothetical protein RR47_GL000983 [Enterococcus columbae DSM 7374 = ATCC 51263]
MNKQNVFSEQAKEVRTRLEEKRKQTQEEIPLLTHNRLCALNDGVIAIILTIMALEIHLPVDNISYTNFLVDVGIFFTSFFVVANFWYENHLTFATFKKATHQVLVFNFSFLALLTLIPVLTKWIMLDVSRLAVMNYGVVYLLIVLLQSLIFSAAHLQTVQSKNPFLVGLMRIRIVSLILLNLGLIAFAYFMPKIAMILYLSLPIYSFLARGRERKQA